MLGREGTHVDMAIDNHVISGPFARFFRERVRVTVISAVKSRAFNKVTRKIFQP